MGSASISKCCDTICEGKEPISDIPVNPNTEADKDSDNEDKLNLLNDLTTKNSCDKNKINNPNENKETSTLSISKQKTNFMQRTVTGAFNKLEYESNKNHNLKGSSKHIATSVKGISDVIESSILSEAKPKKQSQVTIDSIRNNLKNYTFSAEANNLLKTDVILKNILANDMKITSNQNNYIPKIIESRPGQVLLQYEFNVNNYIINNKISRTKTKNLSSASKYVLLTRHAIKICKSRDYYVSYGTSLTEVPLSHITNIELIKNPFSKIMLHTINITYGRDNIKFSLSSEDGKEVEIWFNLISYLIK